MSASDLAAGAVRLVAAEGLAYHVDVHLPHDGGGKLGRCAAAPLRRCAAAPLRALRRLRNQVSRNDRSRRFRFRVRLACESPKIDRSSSGGRSHARDCFCLSYVK